jgi:hypothetical protein
MFLFAPLAPNGHDRPVYRNFPITPLSRVSYPCVAVRVKDDEPVMAFTRSVYVPATVGWKLSVSGLLVVDVA